MAFIIISLSSLIFWVFFLEIFYTSLKVLRLLSFLIEMLSPSLFSSWSPCQSTFEYTDCIPSKSVRPYSAYKKGVLGKTLNYTYWWGPCSVVQLKVKFCFVVITLWNVTPSPPPHYLSQSSNHVFFFAGRWSTSGSRGQRTFLYLHIIIRSRETGENRRINAQTRTNLGLPRAEGGMQHYMHVHS